MRRAASWTWMGLTLLLFGTACSSQSLPPPSGGDIGSIAGQTGTGGRGSGGMGWGGSENVAGRTGSGGNGVGGYICDGVGVIPGNCFGGMTGGGGRGSGGTPLESLGGRTGSAGEDGGPGSDAVCCPPDPNHVNNGCMHLGGASFNGMCYETCDFWCSTNWRLERDAQGCWTWLYDSNGPCLFDASPPFDAGNGN